MEKKTRKPRKQKEVVNETPKTTEQIEEIVKEVKAPLDPKKEISSKMDILIEEMEGIIKEYRKELNTSSCAVINKSIFDLKRVSKNLKR